MTQFGGDQARMEMNMEGTYMVAAENITRWFKIVIIIICGRNDLYWSCNTLKPANNSKGNMALWISYKCDWLLSLFAVCSVWFLLELTGGVTKKVFSTIRTFYKWLHQSKPKRTDLMNYEKI